MGQTAMPTGGRLETSRLPALHCLGLTGALRRLSGLLLVVVMGLALAAPAAALSAADLPPEPPANHVLDQGALLSRAAAGDVSRAMDTLNQESIAATWVSIPRLDYDVSLPRFGEQLLEHWQGQGAAQLLLLIDAQTSATAVVGTAAVQERLGADLLRSTSRTTMAQPLREGSRYRQASLDAIARLSAVAAGQEDPGEPLSASNPVATARVPSREQTLSSNATTWVLVLLAVGTIVPMLTWWVFSR